MVPCITKAQIPTWWGGGGGCGVWDKLSTFDADSKSAKIPNSLYSGVKEGGRAWHQLLMLSPNLLQSKIPYIRGFDDNFLSSWAKSMLPQEALDNYKCSLYTKCTRDHNQIFHHRQLQVGM